MFVLTCILWFISVSPAWAQSPLSVNERQLESAVRNYQSGDRQAAMQIFLSISESPNSTPAFRIEARVYIAEILYIQGDREGAQQWFEKILRENPEFRIDRFRHPPEVCGFFDFVKSYLKPIKKKTQVKTKSSYSPMRLAPFGVYQMQKGQTIKGVSNLALQMGAGALSLGLYVDLLVDHSHLTGDETKRIALERKKMTQQISTAFFYALWALSIYDTHSDIKINFRVDPVEDGVSGFGVSGRF